MVHHAEPVAWLMADEDVLRNGQLRKQGKLLIDDVNTMLLGLARRGPVRRRIGEAYLARVRRIGSGDDLDQGRLAGAVLANQSVNLSGPDLKAHATESANAWKALRDPFEREHE